MQGVSFLLAYDEDYMESAAKCLYGDSFKAEEYLRRFVDVRFWLPQIDNREFIDALLLHYNFPLAAKDQNKGQLIAESLKSWAFALELTLRDAEQAFALCRLLVSHKPNVMPEVLFPCLFFCVARFAPDSDSIGKALARKGKFADVATAMKARMGTARGGMRWEWMRVLLQYADLDEQGISALKKERVVDTDSTELRALSFTDDLYEFPYGNLWRNCIDMVL